MALTKPFAANGDKTPIELNTTSDGVVNYENGFGARYSMPIKAVIDSSGNITKTGGLQIERGQMNQIFNDFSSAIIENQENIGTLSNLTTTNKSNLVSSINEVNNTTPKLLTKNLTWSVGTGGKFTTLREALNEAMKYSRNFDITLKLKSGFIWNQSIAIYNKNLSGIVIESEDHEVIADGSILSSSANNFFLTLTNSVGLCFRILLNCINMNDSPKKHGIAIRRASSLEFFKNTPSQNIGCKGANWNIFVGAASYADLGSAVIENALIAGIHCESSVVNAYNSSFKNCNKGVEVTMGGIVNTSRATFTNNTTNCNIPFNQVTANGIVFN